MIIQEDTYRLISVTVVHRTLGLQILHVNGALIAEADRSTEVEPQ